MQNQDKFIIEVAKSLAKYVHLCDPDYEVVSSMVFAHCCFETGFFALTRKHEDNRPNELVENFNFAGMKYRDCLKNICSPIDFLDWENFKKKKNGKDYKVEKYCAVNSMESGWDLYFAFCNRSVYKSKPSSKNRLSDSYRWILNLGLSGWCSSISTVRKASYLTNIEYEKAVHFEYISRVVDLHNSEKIKNICEDVGIPYQKVTLYIKKEV
ncbi:MAG: hypothetical protein JKY89_12270 [Immundisolibacteraceae bacterium]|nr:hypothetical protein [Immundisolibacteraceae bacterium]